MIKNTPDAWSARANVAKTSWEAALWSEEGQMSRMLGVLAELDPQPNDILLDYGCGTGALSELLDDDVEYFGYDWAEEMIRRARREHPGRGFSTVLSLDRADLIVCIGTFNLRDRWSKGATFGILHSLWRSKLPRRMSVSLYAGDDEECLRYDDEDVARLSALPDIEHVRSKRHRPNDLIVTVSR